MSWEKLLAEIFFALLWHCTALYKGYMHIIFSLRGGGGACPLVHILCQFADVTRSLQRTWSLHCVCICLYLSTRLLGAAVSVCRRPRLRWDCCSWLGSRVGLARPSLGSPPTSDPLGWPAQPSPDTAAARQHQFLIAFCINIAWSWYSALLNYS